MRRFPVADRDVLAQLIIRDNAEAHEIIDRSLPAEIVEVTSTSLSIDGDFHLERAGDLVAASARVELQRVGLSLPFEITAAAHHATTPDSAP
jgi:hypothetical protein